MKGMRTREDILSMMGQIDNIMKGLAITVEEAKRKVEEFSSTPPEPFDLRGLGSILHDFYTSIEDILEVISGEVNGTVLESLDWHKRLLSNMSIPIPELRPAVISESLMWKLSEYLRFRHIFRNVYGYLLDWKRLKPLLDPAVNPVLVAGRTKL